MDLMPYVEHIRRELAVAAEAGGDEARMLAERLMAPLESAIRLTLLDALSRAADEITRELAPGSVHVRLRGSDPDFVVTAVGVEPAHREPELVQVAEDGATARINFRLPEQLKNRVEDAAAGEGLSVNSWLVRAVATTLSDDRGARTPRRPGRGGGTYSGWVH